MQSFKLFEACENKLNPCQGWISCPTKDIYATTLNHEEGKSIFHSFEFNVNYDASRFIMDEKYIKLMAKSFLLYPILLVGEMWLFQSCGFQI